MSPFASIQTPFKVPVNAGALLLTGSNENVKKKIACFFSIDICTYTLEPGTPERDRGARRGCLLPFPSIRLLKCR